MCGCGRARRMKGLDGSLSVRSLLTLSFFLEFCRWLFFSRPGFEAPGARGTDEHVYARSSTGGRFGCIALGLAPAMYVRIPLHTALHCCTVVVRVLLLGVCTVHLSLSHSAAYRRCSGRHGKWNGYGAAEL
jgi:hypothetical protein